MGNMLAKMVKTGDLAGIVATGLAYGGVALIGEATITVFHKIIDAMSEERHADKPEPNIFNTNDLPSSVK